MINFDDKSNNDILLEMKQMELDYEAIKNKVLEYQSKATNHYNNMLKLEDKFKKYSDELIKRNKGTI